MSEVKLKVRLDNVQALKNLALGIRKAIVEAEIAARRASVAMKGK